MDRGASRLVHEEEVELVDRLREVHQINTVVVVPLLGNFPFSIINGRQELRVGNLALDDVLFFRSRNRRCCCAGITLHGRSNSA